MGESYLVKTVKQPVDWTVEVPGSKSMTNRALLAAALSEGTAVLDGVLFSEDSRHFLSCLTSLGFSVKIEEEMKRVTVAGSSGQIPRKSAKINVGSAGTAARFLTAMLGLSDGDYIIESSEQMKKRPMKPLFDLLAGLGAEITCMEQSGFLPIRIRGIYNNTGSAAGSFAKNSMRPLHMELDISKSTQFLSAMLLNSPMVKEGLSIHITSEKKDGSYIRITRKIIEDFGGFVSFSGSDYTVEPGARYRLGAYTVEPDMSAACYFYAAAAVTGGRVVVRDVHSDNTQGDLKFLEVLKRMGCLVTERREGIEVKGPLGGRLEGICVDMNDFSDQALTLAAIAPFAKAPVRITNIGHIRNQESDRIHAIAAELGRLSVRCDEEADAVTVYPGIPRQGAVETYEDHRVAMAFSLIGLRVEGIRILNHGCCAKTFEDYFHLLDRLTGK